MIDLLNVDDLSILYNQKNILIRANFSVARGSLAFLNGSMANYVVDAISGHGRDIDSGDIKYMGLKITNYPFAYRAILGILKFDHSTYLELDVSIRELLEFLDSRGMDSRNLFVKRHILPKFEDRFAFLKNKDLIVSEDLSLQEKYILYLYVNCFRGVQLFVLNNVSSFLSADNLAFFKDLIEEYKKHEISFLVSDIRKDFFTENQLINQEIYLNAQMY